MLSLEPSDRLVGPTVGLGALRGFGGRTEAAPGRASDHSRPTRIGLGCIPVRRIAGFRTPVA